MGRRCCICGENDCSVALSDRGVTILFADGEEAVAEGPHCDCVVVLRRDNYVEIYSVELKRIAVDKNKADDALNPDTLRQKCESCLRWAEEVVNRFNSPSRRGVGVVKNCVVVIPMEVFQRVATLVRRERSRYKPSGTQLRILYCNDSITGYAEVL
ncbi:hypothetical protein [Pyrobaculum neutrophilum]|uniref:hypothetical protein n=1 Tax=Pyrobaculum neutrophilum TaxID=70771 RepID=UPI001FDFC55F|nr:hypothetical protein [Pyrobaculum neutrophilum]